MGKKEKLEYLKSEYHKYDVCMDEMLDDCFADGLTIIDTTRMPCVITTT